MGDILQILIIIGIIVFAVVKQIAGSGEEGKKTQRPPVVVPEEDNDDYWKEMEAAKERPNPFLAYDYDHSTAFTSSTEQLSKRQTNRYEPITPPPPIQEEPDEDNPEFNIESTEEVRRAIIWSEILNRKY